MNAGGDRWTRLGIDLGPLMRSLRTQRKEGASLSQVEISQVPLPPLHQLLSFFLPLLIYGWMLTPPLSITLNTELTHHGKSICVKWNFFLGVGINAFCKRCFNPAFPMARILCKKLLAQRLRQVSCRRYALMCYPWQWVQTLLYQWTMYCEKDAWGNFQLNDREEHERSLNSSEKSPYYYRQYLILGIVFSDLCKWGRLKFWLLDSICKRLKSVHEMGRKATHARVQIPAAFLPGCVVMSPRATVKRGITLVPTSLLHYEDLVNKYTQYRTACVWHRGSSQ